MFEAVIRNGLKEPVFEPFLAIFRTGIDFHAFLLEAPAVAAMCPKACLLVDAQIVKFIKLNIYQPFPFPALFIIIACPVGIQRVVMDAWHKDTGLIIKQIQRVGTD